MAELWDLEEQRVAEVPDDQVGAALESGRFGLRNSTIVDGRTNLVKPDGAFVSVPVAQVSQALRQGYALPSAARTRFEKEKYSDEISPQATMHEAVGQVGSAGLGVLDALTFGLASGTMGDGDEYTRLKMQQAKDRGGYTVGLLGGALVPGGPVATLGRGAGALAKAPVASAALRGAAEGAAIGAGDLISEEGLGRAEFTASAVAAHVGMGAILGGAASGIFGVIPKAVPAMQKGLEKIPGKAKIRQFLRELSDDQAIKATVGHQKRAFKQLEGKGLYDDAADFIRSEAGLSLGDSTASMAEKIPAAVARINKQLDDVVAKIDELSGGAGVDPARVAMRLRDIAKERFSTQSDKSVRAWLLGQADELDAMGEISFARGVVERRGAQRAASYNALEPKPMALAKRLKAQAWNDVMDELARPHLKKAGMAGDAWRKLRRKDWVGIELSKFAEDRVSGDLANSFLSISDIMTGGGVGVATASPLAGAAAALGRKAVKHWGHAAASLAADRATKIRFLQSAQVQVGQRVQGGIERMLSGVKPGPVRPASVYALSDFMLSQEGKAGASMQEAAKLRVAELDRMQADPQYLADRVAAAIGGMEGDAPNTSTALAGKAAAAVQFLASKAPRPSGVTLQPQLDNERWMPSRAEAAKFSRYWAAVMDPLSIIDELEAGVLSSEAVEALRAVYPELLELIATEIQMQAAASNKPISYATKVQLSMLLGRPLAASLTPEAIARRQSYAARNPTDGQGGGGTRLAGIDKLNLSDSIGSRTQQLEASVAMVK